MFSVHTKTPRNFWLNSSGLTSVFERIQFRDELVHVDEKGLAGDIKLRFQIPKAYSFKPQPNGRNIVGRNLLRAFGHPVATCCEVLRYVGCCWLKFENGQRFHATFVDIAWCCGRLAKFVHRCTRACASFLYATATISIYALPLRDALPILYKQRGRDPDLKALR